jgi:hypothetical protein
MFPKTIFLYDGSWNKALAISEIVDYLKKKVGFHVEWREDLLSKLKISPPETIQDIIFRLCSIRIRDIASQTIGFKPLPGELLYEEKTLYNPEKRVPGVLYEGFQLQQFYFSLIPEEEKTCSFIHIIFTNQMFATWDKNDRRYHARASIYSFPCLISTTGLIEAPAKPREYYLKRQTGILPETLREELKGRYLDYEDKRLTEVIKGYVMQAIFFHMTGNPFCENKDCRLYNAHWQEELIHAQLKTGNEFCKVHEEMVERLRTGNGEL